MLEFGISMTDALLTIVCGVTCSGKTTFCRNIYGEENFIKYDKVFDYPAREFNVERFTEQMKVIYPLPTRNIVVDGFGFGKEQFTNIQKMLLDCGYNLVFKRIFYVYSSLEELDGYQCSRWKSNRLGSNQNKIAILNLEEATRNLKCSGKVDEVVYVRRFGKQYLVSNNNIDFLKTLNMLEQTEFEILKYIDENSGDPKYQSVEFGGKILRSGYCPSETTWENIQKLGISFRDKSVCDIGCYNGYFSFKVEECDPLVVTSFDNNTKALVVANTIKYYRGSKCNFYYRNMGLEEQSWNETHDVILALNMLHHVKFQCGESGLILALDRIFSSCKEFVTEINQSEYEVVKSTANKYGFEEKVNLVGHRQGNDFKKRFLIYFVRNV